MFILRENFGQEVVCLVEGCGFLDGGNWKIIKEVETEDAEKPHEIKLVVHVDPHPLGFKQIEVNIWFTTDEVDVNEIARDEGQCLVFKLVDGNCSTDIMKRLQGGKLIEDYVHWG